MSERDRFIEAQKRGGLERQKKERLSQRHCERWGRRARQTRHRRKDRCQRDPQIKSPTTQAGRQAARQLAGRQETQTGKKTDTN